VFHTVDGAEAARAVGVARSPQGTLAEALYLHLVAKRPPRDQFASRADTRRHFIWQLQRGVVAAGALGFAACLIVAGARWLDAASLREQALGQRLLSQVAAEQYQRITAGFPVTQTSTENLKVAVVEFRRIAERSAAPEQAFVHVSRVLQQFPQMELDGLTWTVGRPADRREQRPAQRGAATKPEVPGAEGVLLEITGRVNATQRDDYRGITAQVQQFASALGGSSGYEIIATKLPFDITSEGTLTGDIGGAETGDAPRFTIVLAWRLP
jgi:hypothetical protein